MFAVHEEETLFRRFVVSLDGQCEGVVANEATVADEVRSVDELVEVSEDIEVCTPSLVPLSNGFVDRDIDTPDSSAILHRVSVVQSDDVPVDVQVGVVASSDDESDTLVPFEQVRKVMIHEELQ